MILLEKVVSCVALGLLVGALGCNTAATEMMETGGNYGPVTRDMLSGASYKFATGRDRDYDDFQWTFSKATFEIKAGPNGLPPELSESLLPSGVTAAKIEGTWSVADDVITFSDIKADGESTKQEPRKLKTMFTGVLRIVAGRQYVFVRKSVK